MEYLILPGAIALREWENRALAERGAVSLDGAFLLDRVRAELVEGARGHGLLNGRSLSELERFAMIHAVLRGAPGERLREAMGFAGALHAMEAFARTLSAVAVSPRELADLFEPESVGEVPGFLWAGFAAYRHELARLGCVDRLDENRVVLELISRRDLPLPGVLGAVERGLREGHLIVFKSVRWLDPFRHRLILALLERWDGRGVRIESILPDELMDRWQGEVLASEIRGICQGARDARGYAAAWYGLLDAWAVLDPVIALQQRDAGAPIEFSTSVGVYGEVEDLARRVVFAIEHEGIAPERIGLVFRDLGDRSEALVDVFHRFGIPISFRRGVPMSAAPCVQVLLGMLRLPAGGFRRRPVEQAVNSPWLQLMPEGAGDVSALLGALRRSGVRALAQDGDWRHLPEVRSSRLLDWLKALKALEGNGRSRSIAEWAESVQELIVDWMPVQERILPRLGAQAGRVPVIQNLQLNALAFRRLRLLLGELMELPPSGVPMDLEEFCSFLGEWSSRETVPLYTDEAGVRVLNPFDACGLELDLVLIGGLNAGVFPGDGGRDSVWTDPMITAVEGRLRALGVDAGLAWPTDAHRAQQERLLFFGAALSSTGGLVLSCQSHGEDGQVEVPSIFFEVPWYLAGWPSLPRLTDSALSRYERWRLERVPALVRAWARACQCERAHHRRPFAGDSGPATRPEGVCLAIDEWRQARVLGAVKSERDLAESGLEEGVVRLIRVERERDAFMTDATAMQEGASSPYCGGFQEPEDRALQRHWLMHRLWSPSALGSLLNCRYQFLCRYGLGLTEVRGNEDLPDPRDRGQVWHRVMAAFFLVKRGMIPDWASPGTRFHDDWKRLASELGRTNSLEREGDCWVLREGVATGRPITVLQESRAGLESQCRRVFELVCREMETGGAFLGDPHYWELERERGWAGLVRMLEDVGERDGRLICPADLEWEFGKAGGDAAPVQVWDLAGERSIRVAGVVDRADVWIDGTGELSRVEVWDYKGRSKETAKSRDIVDKVEVQMPVYWMAASARWGMPWVRKAGYLIYDPAVANMAVTILEAGPTGMCDWSGKLVLPEMEGMGPLDMFRSRVWAALELVFAGDYSLSPKDCSFCEFAHVCRVEQRSLESNGGES